MERDRDKHEDRRPDPMTWVCRFCRHRNLWWKNTCERCGRAVDD